MYTNLLSLFQIEILTASHLFYPYLGSFPEEEADAKRVPEIRRASDLSYPNWVILYATTWRFQKQLMQNGSQQLPRFLKLRDLCSRPCAHNCGDHQVGELCIGDMSRRPTRQQKPKMKGLESLSRIKLVNDFFGTSLIRKPSLNSSSFWRVENYNARNKSITKIQLRKSWSALDGLGLARWSQQDVGIFVKDNHGNNSARLKACFQE